MKQRTTRNAKRQQRQNADAPASKSRYARKVRAGNMMYGPTPRVPGYPNFRPPWSG